MSDYLRKQTFGSVMEMSALGHKQTHAVQQTSSSGRSVDGLTAPTFMALVCRWRSRP